MQPTERRTETSTTQLPVTVTGSDRKRVETVVETLAMVGNRGETLAEVAHDTRNMVTALGLYCDLLEEPGVLSAPFSHYGTELRLVASASRRLVEKLVALDAQTSAAAALPPVGDEAGEEADPWPTTFPAELLSHRPARRTAEAASPWEAGEGGLIGNLAAELMATRNLLAALAGPSVIVTLDTEGGALPVRMNGEDLTRILVNLIKNSAEAMEKGGRIRIALRETAVAGGAAERLRLSIEDSGPGIAAEVLEAVFESGYTTRGETTGSKSSWTARHRGLGLTITRSIVEAAGGTIKACTAAKGARIEIDLPVRTGR
ncbi:MAG: sensor histidine kinase [Terracidiphilus sp.]|nr:sensor histidine kinase [Terracidiphilus sp.]